MTRVRSRKRPWSAALGIVSALSTVGCTTLASPPREPALDGLVVTDLAVIPMVLEGAEADGRAWFRDLLSQQASATARRTALEWQLARSLNSQAGSTQALHLKGHVSIPVALPPEYRGSRAAFQEGHLAVAQLVLIDHGEAIVATTEVNVRWDQVRWTTGSHKTRKARRPEASLIDAVELAVERAVRQLLPLVPPEAETRRRRELGGTSTQ